MSSDFEGYEQDFAVLTAEITNRIGKVPKLLGDEKKQMVSNVEKQLEEARELKHCPASRPRCAESQGMGKTLQQAESPEAETKDPDAVVALCHCLSCMPQREPWHCHARPDTMPPGSSGCCACGDCLDLWPLPGLPSHHSSAW
ncbi:UNVERIFIED_CONTAM: hypothetical protein K2H54_045186 [Gekko kuhli]